MSPLTAGRFGRKTRQSGPDLDRLFLAALAILALCAVAAAPAHGHGVGSETFPPVDLGGRQATLEVSSSQNAPGDGDRQISISLIDFDSKVTLRDVTFAIRSERGGTFLFEREFAAPNGFVVFNFASEDAGQVTVQEEEQGNILGSLLGLESRLVHVRGQNLAAGGLYTFDVSVTEAEGAQLGEPIIFNAGISIPQTTSHAIDDPDYGAQAIDIITYYDEISNFEYDPATRTMKYEMPFEWSVENINQTSVVHEEVAIPKSFGGLLASEFVMNVNGVDLPQDVVSIDDFMADDRIVHFTIYQRDLLHILGGGESGDRMYFEIRPGDAYPAFSSVTENGQFRILASLEQEEAGRARAVFAITDVFLKDRPVAESYELVVMHGGQELHRQAGTSTGERGVHDTAEFAVPDGATGAVWLHFEKIGGNGLARASIPVTADSASTPQMPAQIPDWVRNNAAWWAGGEIDDETFIRGIEYLVQNGTIRVTAGPSQPGAQGIPDWVRNNAAWWAGGEIDDETFIRGIEYLVQNGTIRV